jgi:hypothetical protein
MKNTEVFSFMYGKLNQRGVLCDVMILRRGMVWLGFMIFKLEYFYCENYATIKAKQSPKTSLRGP